MTQFNNAVCFTAQVGWTKDFVVASAVSGCVTPQTAKAQDGMSYNYYATTTDSTEWERGVGTWINSINTLARTTITASSSENSDGTYNKINFTTVPTVTMFPAPSTVLNPGDQMSPVMNNSVVSEIAQSQQATITQMLAAIAAKQSLIGINSYTWSQSITVPQGATKARLKMWGGTGGSGGGHLLPAGGGSNYVATIGASGGTGASGYLEKLFLVKGGQVMTFTCGAAGAAGASGGGNGGNGGTSTLTFGQITLTATGSPGSIGVTGNPCGVGGGSVGGIAMGGDINIIGQGGAAGSVSTNYDIVKALEYPTWCSGNAGIGPYIQGAYGNGNYNITNGFVDFPGTAGYAGGLIIEWYA